MIGKAAIFHSQKFNKEVSGIIVKENPCTLVVEIAHPKEKRHRDTVALNGPGPHEGNNLPRTYEIAAKVKTAIVKKRRVFNWDELGKGNRIGIIVSNLL